MGDEPVQTEKREQIREKLSTMSFEDLLKLKGEIGTKLLNESILGRPTKNSNVNFKRANKNRPREESSKIRTFPNKKNSTTSVKSTPRDPRFDPLCGTFDKQIFKENYKFIYDIKVKERKQLQKELKDEEDPARIAKIKSLIQRLDNQISENKNREKAKLADANDKKEMKECLQKGLKPAFKKKSEKRIEDAIEKYNELKKSNSLKKYFQRKSKKIAKKDQKKNS